MLDFKGGLGMALVRSNNILNCTTLYQILEIADVCQLALVHAMRPPIYELSWKLASLSFLDCDVMFNDRDRRDFITILSLKILAPKFTRYSILELFEMLRIEQIDACFGC